MPDPQTISAVQQSWQLVKKQADIIILIDTSGSMNDENKIGQAKEAIRVFLEDQTSKNNVGLIEFNTTVRTLTPLGSLESNRAQIINQVNGLRANGNTALFDAMLAAVKEVDTRSDSTRIQAILLLSDGQDTASKTRINDVVREINLARNGRTPVLVIPIAYGKDADVNSLSAMARASDTKVQSGDPQGIRKLLEIIGSYF